MNRVKLLLKLAATFRRALDGIDRNGAEHDDKNGRFTGKGNSSGGAANGTPIKKPTESANNGGQPKENGYNESATVNASGSHTFPKTLFMSKQKFKNHFAKHKKEFEKIGITTEAQYKRETRRIIESPVGGDILGHIANKKYNQIVRYDKQLNLFVKGNPNRGVFTSFVPNGNLGVYYQEQRKKDTEHDGEG